MSLYEIGIVFKFHIWLCYIFEYGGFLCVVLYTIVDSPYSYVYVSFKLRRNYVILKGIDWVRRDVSIQSPYIVHIRILGGG